ncbi:ASCH domain-containing protein [Geoglobus ahangari]
MKHLEFKGKYLQKLLSGEKRATIRKRVYVKPGELVYVHCGGKIVGRARIKDVREIGLDEIDEEIARKEGFESAEELVAELRGYYSDRDRLYLIEFDFEPFEKPLDPAEMYYENDDLIEIARKAVDSDALSEEEKEVLRLFLKTGSIRKTAFRLGGLSRRGVVREALRKARKIVNEQK